MRRSIILKTVLGVALASPAGAQEADVSAGDEAAELAKKLANPIASLVSLPLQYNYDAGYGPDGDGSVSRLNIQPVIPTSLSADWNLIMRIIVPVLYQEETSSSGDSEFGLGDVTASAFMSPTSRGWVWGVGPVVLLPTATQDVLGGGQWGAGPTAVMLRQVGPWTVGGLVNHIWSVVGEDERADVSATFVQPFVSYIFAQTKTTVGLVSETAYDWEGEAWAIPMIASVSQLLKIGSQITQLQLGAKYWAESPEGGPEDWGLRVGVTFLFPK
jgi:hypothetical protein